MHNFVCVESERFTYHDVIDWKVIGNPDFRR